MVDVMVYRAAGWTVRTGGDLYAMRFGDARLPMTYPPFAGLLFVPLTWVAVGTMRTAVTALNLLLTVVLAALSLRLVARPVRVPAVILIAGLAVWSEPVWATLRYGQVNLLVAVLVLWDVTRRAESRWAGVGIGIAAGIKLTPALFVVFLALATVLVATDRARYLRRALTAAATFVATVLVGVAALPHDSRAFWTRVVFTPDRPGRAENAANQSVRGVVARLEHTGTPGPAWVLAALAAGVLGLAVAVAAARAADRLPLSAAWAAVAVGVTALLISPVSWTHHWVWAVPMIVLLVSETLRRRDGRWACAALAAVLVFCSYVVWYVPHDSTRPELHENAGEMLVAAAYPLGGLAFLALTGVVAARALRTPAHDRGSGRPVRRVRSS
ncbi:glycosyltransferase 87 family protein [Streptomyces sp. PLK6-54]|uniref:Glycosyltransferase 87 family protein n=2 Tax=Actinacidiphila acidipaludis TaxID=2873382 RepID=A0ABS7Q3G3_9ACTN|nr:glycosyltransferase 87 family protein [Streptomyces acidipaludis]